MIAAAGKCLPPKAPRRGTVITMANRKRLQVLYSGRVQGVGFRYTAKTVANGYEVTGTIRNLPDGRVELILEGEKEEAEAFRQALKESGLGAFIDREEVKWSEATGTLRGFEIVR